MKETLFEIKDVGIFVTRDSDLEMYMLKNQSSDTCGVLGEMFWRKR